MPLVNPIEESRRRKGRRQTATATARTRQRATKKVETARCRKCVNTHCKGDMTLAASRGHKVLVCMTCSTAIPVTADWQVTGEKPPRDAVEEKSGMVVGPPIDVHKALRRKDIELSGEKAALKTDTLDVSWLKPASAKLNISPSIKDYVMVPVILFYASVPNRNGLGFLQNCLLYTSPSPRDS